MAGAKSTTPALRFKGFVEEWEERPLKEVAVKVVEKNINLQFSETLTNSAEFGVISQRDYFDHDISNSDNIGTYYVVKNEDFVYNPRISTFAPVGPINRNKLGRSGVMSPLYTVLRTHDIDNTYLEQYFKGGMWHSFMKLNGDSGARSDRFSIKDSVFVEMPIPYPELNEQARVGKYFDNLDGLIALQRRKLVKLQNVKKAMLQKMFPTRGSTTPQIRFAGFTEPWQEQRLGDLAAQTYGGGTPATANEKYWGGDIPWIQSSDLTENKLSGVIPRKYVTNAGLRASATRLVPKNSIAIITRVGVGKLAIMPFAYTTSQDFLSLSNLKADAQFSAYVIYNRLQSELHAVQGTSIKGITKEELLAKELLLPEPAEQIKIGIYFEHLDTRISLQQRKLEKLQNVKKACLAAMFV